MAFVAYSGLKNANDVLFKMSEYVKSRGYTVVTDCVDDTNVYDRSTYDGKRLVFLTKDEKYYVNMRSANGINIFGSAYDYIMDTRPRQSGDAFQGIGLTVSERQVYQTRWYNQYHAPLGRDADTTVQAVFMPLKNDSPPVEPIKPDPVDEPEEPTIDLPDEPIEPQEPERPIPIRTTKVSDMPTGNAAFPTYYQNDDGERIYYQPDMYYEDSWVHHYGPDLVVVLTATRVIFDSHGTPSYNNQGTVSSPNRAGSYSIDWPDHLEYQGNIISSAADIQSVPHNDIFERNDVLSSSQNPLDPVYGPNAQLLAIKNASGSIIGSFSYLIMSSDAWDYFKSYDYSSKLAQYNQERNQYLQDYEDWQNAHKEWEDETKELKDEYSKQMAEYVKQKALFDQYLKDLEAYEKAYEEWLVAYELWRENLCEYTLYCNNIVDKEDILWFSLVKYDKHKTNFWQTTHLGVGNLTKYSKFEGGIWFTGSAHGPSMAATASRCYEDNPDADRYILPVLSSGEVSNTFLRMDIDDAPSYERGEIIWASSGTNNETGKRLSLPIRTILNANGAIPHYYGMQSRSRTDWGMDINTLNGITVNMPIYFAVLIDPDYNNEYSAVGFLDGIYFCCNLNMQTAHKYNIFYPTHDNIYQVFPARGQRRGMNGFDAISIRQKENTDLNSPELKM